MAAKPKPDGYHTITPYLIVEDADKLVEFIENVFDGQLLFKMENEKGRLNVEKHFLHLGRAVVGEVILRFDPRR